MIELLTLNEESVWVSPAHIVAIENTFDRDDTWDGTRVTLSTGRVVASVLSVDQINDLADAEQSRRAAIK